MDKSYTYSGYNFHGKEAAFKMAVSGFIPERVERVERIEGIAIVVVIILLLIALGIVF